MSLTVSEQADSIAVAVEDRGPGISDGELGMVFEPYVRLEGVAGPAHRGQRAGAVDRAGSWR